MRRAWHLAISSIVLLSLVITACSRPTAPQTPQVLRVNVGSEPNQIDPNRASTAYEQTVIKQVFEGLLTFDAGLALKADVAKEIPTVANGGISADGKTYIFKLRNDVTWSDGQKVTAKDFEYSIKRMLSPEAAAQYASFYYAISGAESYNGGKGSAADVAIKATDDYTLQITLTQPSPTFLQVMALWPVYPVRQDIIEKYGDAWTDSPTTYIGDGPFVMTDRSSDHIILKANQSYWGTKPKLAEIDLSFITDANAQMAAFRNNEVDIIAVPVGDEKATMADKVLGPQVLLYPALSTYGFMFNVTVPPFNNVKVRQAIATAIDRASFINNVRSGVGKPATSWIPPGMPGYDPNLGSQYIFNAQNARQLLADAGYADPSKLPPIAFQYSPSGNNKTIAEFLQAQMKDNLGINVTLERYDGKAFQQLLFTKKFTWALFGWVADYPDPDDWLPEFFGTGGGANLSGYSNPQFDTISQQAKVELDNSKRLALWAQAQQIIVNDMPIAFLYYGERIVLVNSKVKGLVTTGMDGAPGDQFYNLVSISQ